LIGGLCNPPLLPLGSSRRLPPSNGDLLLPSSFSSNSRPPPHPPVPCPSDPTHCLPCRLPPPLPKASWFSPPSPPGNLKTLTRRSLPPLAEPPPNDMHGPPNHCTSAPAVVATPPLPLIRVPPSKSEGGGGRVEEFLIVEALNSRRLSV
jgi:hypothetical protein